MRIPVAALAPDRSQRRCLARNADVHARIVAPVRTDEHLALYRKYLTRRHPDGGMDDHGALEFEQFLVGRWNDGRFLELREDGSHRLLCAGGHRRGAGRALGGLYLYDPMPARAGWARWRSSGNWNGPAATGAPTSTSATGSQATRRWITSAASARWRASTATDGGRWSRPARPAETRRGTRFGDRPGRDVNFAHHSGDIAMR